MKGSLDIYRQMSHKFGIYYINKWLSNVTKKIPGMRKDSDDFKKASLKAYRTNMHDSSNKDGKLTTIKNMSEHFTVFMEIVNLKDSKE